MIEVDNYLSAEDVMPFKKLALMSDDNFVLTFNKSPLHLRVQQYVNFHRYKIRNVYTQLECDNDATCMVDVIGVFANNKHYLLGIVKHGDYTLSIHHQIKALFEQSGGRYVHVKSLLDVGEAIPCLIKF
jgi:hypothetical protein